MRDRKKESWPITLQYILFNTILFDSLSLSLSLFLSLSLSLLSFSLSLSISLSLSYSLSLSLSYSLSLSLSLSLSYSLSLSLSLSIFSITFLTLICDKACMTTNPKSPEETRRLECTYSLFSISS